MPTTVLVEPDEMKRLEGLAKRLGLTTRRGSYTGRGSVSHLLRAIASGDVGIIAPDVVIGLGQLASVVGFVGADGQPDVSKLLADIAHGYIRLETGLRMTGFLAQGLDPAAPQVVAFLEAIDALPAILHGVMDAVDAERARRLENDALMGELTSASARKRIEALGEGIESESAL